MWNEVENHSIKVGFPLGDFFTMFYELSAETNLKSIQF